MQFAVFESRKTSPLRYHNSMRFIYEEHSLKPGIYKIINTHTNRVYVGQAKEFKNRWMGHRSSLINNKHQNKFLLNDFNRCQEELGHNDFLEFHILEVMENSTKEERNRKEEFYIQAIWDMRDQCYNFKQKSEAKDRNHYSNTPEKTKLKKSSSMKRIWENEEFRSSLSDKAKERWNTPEGKIDASRRAQEIWSDPEHRKTMSEHLKDRMLDPEQKQAAIKNLNSEASVKKRAETYRAKLIEEPEFLAKMQAHGRKNIAKRNATQPVKTYSSVIAPDGVVYEHISHIPTFAKKHGLQKQNLYSLLLGKIKSHKGWRIVKSNIR